MAIANYKIKLFKNVSEAEFFIKTAITAAVLTGGDQTFGFTFGAVGESLIVEGSSDGGVTFSAFKRTLTIADAGAHANIAALLAEINTGANWDGGVLPTEFVITNATNALVITHALEGNDHALRISPDSTAIGLTTDADLLFVANVKGQGNKGSKNLSTVEHVSTDDNGTIILAYITS